MNYIKSLFITIIPCFLIQNTCYADEIILVSYIPYPVITQSAQFEAPSITLTEPGNDFHPAITNPIQPAQPPISGIFSSYGGYLASSDLNGITTFPRRHEKPALNILVTEKITPVMMANNTIHHWELEKGTRAAMYRISRQKSELANLFYWDAQEITVPQDNRIPIDTLIIFTQPQNIYVPIGITPTKDRPNLILPEIYIKSGITTYEDPLYILNIRYFFGPVQALYKTTPTSYIELLK